MTLIQISFCIMVAMVVLKQHVQAVVAVQTMVQGTLQHPKFCQALFEKHQKFSRLERDLTNFLFDYHKVFLINQISAASTQMLSKF